ncbi:hypothetical protein OSB04_022431 [Centaurea solstitialis]|uniref:Protein kinase domain-containing protein n=1 Tax=Centaurea solstitialis TaxID=347529 RepID=A0AA38T3X6_9ASTR|nr:hypothetical protein OSB04_022431 [Centaurea solstitialis]
MKRLIQFQLICVTLGFFLATSEAVLPNEVHALRAFKEAIFDDPFLILSNWNGLDSDPCNWTGVFCSGDHVTKVILHGNNLIGPIPKEIGLLKRLKILDLGMNQLSGPIPHEIGGLVSVVKINLQSNGLTGRLPPELGNLKNLQELRLNRNKLQGTVPGANATDFASSMRGMYASNTSALGFCRASPLKVADFSFNFLEGSIPKCLEYLPRSSFQGNCIRYKDIKARDPAQCVNIASPAKPQKQGEVKHQPAEDKNRKPDLRGSKPVWILALEVVTGVMVGSIFLAAIVVAAHRCKVRPQIVIPWKKSVSDKDHTAIFIDFDLLKDVTRYSRQELEVACEDFSNIIGSSADSVVYKGTLKGGPEIAVISLCNRDENWTGYLELYFQKEVADLARLNHENIGKLLGYCIESSPLTRMLVFEYASNGTLSEHLHCEEGCQLSWTRRMTIVIGIAKGLKYLHTEIEPPFTISELNSSAIYLTEDFSPKLVDFESWKTILTRSGNSSRCISNEGAAMCIPSGSLEERHLDINGNIYGFGVLLLEIVSGRLPVGKEKGVLVNWAKDYLEEPEKAVSIVDPALKHFREEDLEAIREVVGICFGLRPRDNVNMEELCTILESKLDTSGTTELKASSLAWAELALSS